MKKLLIICILIVSIIFISGCTSDEKLNSIETKASEYLINPTTLLKGYLSNGYTTAATSKMNSYEAEFEYPNKKEEISYLSYEGELPNDKKRIKTYFNLKNNDNNINMKIEMVESDSDIKFEESFSKYESYLAMLRDDNYHIETNIIGDYSIMVSQERIYDEELYGSAYLQFSYKNYIIKINTDGPNRDECQTETMKLAKAILDELK